MQPHRGRRVAATQRTDIHHIVAIRCQTSKCRRSILHQPPYTLSDGLRCSAQLHLPVVGVTLAEVSPPSGKCGRREWRNIRQPRLRTLRASHHQVVHRCGRVVLHHYAIPHKHQGIHPRVLHKAVAAVADPCGRAAQRHTAIQGCITFRQIVARHRTHTRRHPALYRRHRASHQQHTHIVVCPIIVAPTVATPVVTKTEYSPRQHNPSIGIRHAPPSV